MSALEQSQIEAEGVDDSAILDKALGNDNAIVETPEMDDPVVESKPEEEVRHSIARSVSVPLGALSFCSITKQPNR